MGHQLVGTNPSSFGGNVAVAAFFAANGATPVTPTTGWGTSIGGTVIGSYNITDAGGSNSNTNKAVAEIITVLKAVGLIKA